MLRGVRGAQEQRERTISATERRVRAANARLSPEVSIVCSEILADLAIAIATRPMTDAELRSVAEQARGAYAFANSVESRLAIGGYEVQ